MTKTVMLSADRHELAKFDANDSSEQSRTWPSVSHADKKFDENFLISFKRQGPESKVS